MKQNVPVIIKSLIAGVSRLLLACHQGNRSRLSLNQAEAADIV